MKFSYLKKISLLALLSAVVFFQSCDSDPDPVVPVGESGFFVVNEGAPPSPNTSISFYDRKKEQIVNDIFSAKNGRPLGVQAQSVAVFEGKAYVVVQGSGKIEVINPDDFSSIATIDKDLPSPRYFVGISPTKAYVSDWGADGLTGTIKVLDLTTFTVTKTIPIGQGPNRLLKSGNRVYIANTGGGYGGYDNTVKVMDTDTDAVVATITTGDNPNSLQQDNDGNIWVATKGKIVYNEDWSVDEEASTKGSIVKIAPDHSIALTLEAKSVGESPFNLEISPDGKTLYYLQGDYIATIYSMSTTATSLPTTPFVANTFYGMAVDPFNGNVIGCKAPNFSSAGSLEIYTSGASFVKSVEVGIGPNGCYFK